MSADFIVYATTNAAKDGFNSEGDGLLPFLINHFPDT